MKTVLKDRTLWYDGSNEVNAEAVADLILLGVSPDKIICHPDEDVQKYNNLVDSLDEIVCEKIDNCPLDLTWNIPKKYIDLDLQKYVVSLASRYGTAYVQRVQLELEQIQKRDLQSVFKTLIYIVDVLKENQQVWGVGRGSSCACLILFLIDLHKVDPLKYNIPIEEFFHD